MRTIAINLGRFIGRLNQGSGTVIHPVDPALAGRDRLGPIYKESNLTPGQPVKTMRASGISGPPRTPAEW